MGTGFTLTIEWDPTFQRWAPHTADIKESWSAIIKYCIKEKSEGWNLVLADGASNSQLILAETIIALKILALGGNFILKVFTTVKRPMVDLVYLISCFEKV